MMAPLLILQSDDTSCDTFVARRVRVRDRLVARLKPSQLDSELARGVPAEARAALALRAQNLGEPRTRRALAQAVHRILDEARREPKQLSFSGRVSIRRKDILAAADLLDEIAARLLAPGPLCARGIAEVRLLLTDGSGPLYFRHASTALGDSVAKALDGLEPAFQW
jgi:hypothetical protein